MVPSEVPNHIERKEWTEVLKRIDSHPSELRSWDNHGYLFIHRALYIEDVPVEVIEALIKAYPESLEQKSKITGILPLLCAVRHYSCPNSNIIKLLVQNYKNAVTATDEDGRTPLIYHLLVCQSPSLEIVNILVEAHSDVVLMRDSKKWYPLHYAAYRGNWEISQYLIQCYPDVLLEENNDNRTPRDITICNCRYAVSEKLREEEETRFGKSDDVPPPSMLVTGQHEQNYYYDVANYGPHKTSFCPLISP